MNSNNMDVEIDLGGQVAIVTGGGRGIGQAMALALARAGAAVAVVARSEDQLAQTVAMVEEAGGQAIAFTADVTDQQATEEMARTVEQRLGPVDLLVNNAGAPAPTTGPLWETEPEEWWKCMDVNLRGPFLCSRAVLPGMVARHRGRIVTTASSSGLAPGPCVSAYAISKCAAIRFSENLAAETKGHGISVFAISPGLVRTAMTESIARSPDDEKWFGGFFGKSFAAGHDVPPERAADLVVLLASGQADALSGCYIGVGSEDPFEMMQRAEEIQQDELYTLRLRT